MVGIEQALMLEIGVVERVLGPRPVAQQIGLGPKRVGLQSFLQEGTQPVDTLGTEQGGRHPMRAARAGQLETVLGPGLPRAMQSRTPRRRVRAAAAATYQ